MTEKSNNKPGSYKDLDKGYQPKPNGGYQPPKQTDKPSPPPKKP